MSIRPLRETLSPNSLRLMGVPKQYVDITLEDFICYSDALSVVKDYVADFISNLEQNIRQGRGIVFFGSNGVGKSMLSCIILKEAYRHRYSCRRITFSQYVTKYKEALITREVGGLTESDFYDNYKAVEFLVLEELGKEFDNKFTRDILDDLLRYREENCLSTIICTNSDMRNAEEIFGESISSLINNIGHKIKIVAKDRRGISV